MFPVSSFPAGERAQLDDLRRRVADLERMRMSGIGISNTNGSSGWVAPQVGFPAIITSTFSQDTGYDWERLILNGGVTPPVVEAYEGPLTGQNAVAIDNDETLTVDTRCWLEPDPNGAGFLLVSIEGSGEEPCPTGCGFVAGWTAEDCLSLSVVSGSGACSDVDAGQVIPLSWDTSNWQSEDDFLYPGGSGAVVFWLADGRPRLSIDGVELNLVCCAEGSVLFAAGEGLGLCNGTHVPCGPNTFTVKIECVECPVEPGIVTTCCPDYEIPATLFITFSDGTGTCSCMDGVTVQLDYAGTFFPGGSYWTVSGTFAAPEFCGADFEACESFNNSLVLRCDDFSNEWVLQIGDGSTCLGITTNVISGGSTGPVATVCGPLLMTGSFTGSIGCSGGGTFTVTETAP